MTNLSEPAAKILAAAQNVFSIEAETVQTLVTQRPRAHGAGHQRVDGR